MIYHSWVCEKSINLVQYLHKGGIAKREIMQYKQFVEFRTFVKKYESENMSGIVTDIKFHTNQEMEMC